MMEQSTKNNQIVDAGIRVGKIRRLEMGVDYTTVEIIEMNRSVQLSHSILVKNELGCQLKVGQNVRVKLEIFE